jgi:hypothetical protein
MAQRQLSRSIKLCGTEEPPVRLRTLQAGDLSADFDQGALRYIRYRGVEVLRGISFLARDANWGTYSATLSDLKVRQTRKGFSVSYKAVCRDGTQELHYTAAIEAADGVITFQATGTPTTDFLTNRTGFVVLHPLCGVVGAPVEIIHTNGEKQKTRFPKFISPGQPVFEIRSLKHKVMPGVTATVLMEGNKFEMEDHRNWMDASFKTYVCSLLDPWPYTLPKGKPFQQSITVTLSGKPVAAKRSSAASSVFVSLGKAKGRLPQFSTGVSMAEAKTAKAHVELIRKLGLSALVCQIDGRQEGQAEAAADFAEISQRCAIPVKLEVILPAKASADAEVGAIADSVRAGGLTPGSVVITQAHDLKSFQPGSARPWGPSYEEMAAAVRSHFPGAQVGGGMLSYFTELNRKPLPAGLFDFVTHTVCPIVHAADDVSVMETLEALPSIFASTRSMAGKLPYHIGPSGISCRDNPYGAGVASNPHNGRVCLSGADPRQKGLFAAAWNLGLVAAAAQGKIEAIAVGAATGPRGAIADGGVHPVYHVLRGLGGGGKRHIAAESSAPGKIVALALQSGRAREIWLANLTAERQVARVQSFQGGAVLTMLDTSTFKALSRDGDYMKHGGTKLKKVAALELDAYAVARLVAD